MAGGNGKKRQAPKKPKPKKPAETMIAAGGRGKKRKKKGTA